MFETMVQFHIFLGIVFSLLALVLVFLYWYFVKFKKASDKKEEEIKHQVYELSILKEISDKIGYSLNLENISDTIASSLSRFIDYSVAGYMLVSPDKILFKVVLGDTASQGFVDDVKNRMNSSLSALLDRDISKNEIEEIIISGELNSKNKEPVESFFNIPLIVGGTVRGVLTIAHTKSGLYKEKEMTLLYKIVSEALSSVARLESVIKNEHGKLGAMVEGMEDGILMTDNDYRIIAANPASKNIISFRNKKDVNIFDFIDSFGDKFNLKSALEESITLSKVSKTEDVFINNRIFQILVFPVVRNGSVFGAVVVFHDVTQEKEAEKIRKDFISMMVHELRTPLDGIKKIGELMKSDKSIRENLDTYGEYIGMIHESSSGMLELVNDLLDVSRIESGEFSIYIKPVNIEDLIKQRVKFFEALSNSSKVKLSAKFSDRVPKVVNLDSSKIAQVLNNLISNAIKFTRADGHVIIQVFTHKKGENINDEARSAGFEWFKCNNNTQKYSNSLIIAVTDTGDGISSENMAKLFNKFVQFESSARDGRRGTGLGLVITRGIVEAHNGVLVVNSKKGEGSTFYFTINL